MAYSTQHSVKYRQRSKSHRHLGLGFCRQPEAGRRRHAFAKATARKRSPYRGWVRGHWLGRGVARRRPVASFGPTEGCKLLVPSARNDFTPRPVSQQDGDFVTEITEETQRTRSGVPWVARVGGVLDRRSRREQRMRGPGEPRMADLNFAANQK